MITGPQEFKLQVRGGIIDVVKPPEDSNGRRPCLLWSPPPSFLPSLLYPLISLSTATTSRAIVGGHQRLWLRTAAKAVG